MPTIKNGKLVITQEDIDKIITPSKSREESIRLAQNYEHEYEESKKRILNIMERNIELYRDSFSKGTVIKANK
mgnify:CR=1 FL=1